MNEKCVICGTSMEDGSTMVFSKNRATVCHAHQNHGEDSEPGSHGCGHDCHFKEPYGFVPEAGCPLHDTQASRAGTRNDRKINQLKP